MQHLEGFLGKMCPVIQEQVANAQRAVPLADMQARAAERSLPLIDVKGRLVNRQSPVAVIAEIKRASPSLRTISDRDILAQVQAYVDGGAAAISVLTEPSHFKGSIDDLTQLKESFPTTPFLRKDFIISEYQIYQSRAIGADMLLLITQWLTDEELRKLYQLTRVIGLHALVEVETGEDLQRTRAIGAEIIGINARNLIDLTVDVHSVSILARAVRDKDFILIGESGVDNPEIVYEWHEAGVDAVLVGGALMKADDPASEVRKFSLV